MWMKSKVIGNETIMTKKYITNQLDNPSEYCLPFQVTYPDQPLISPDKLQAAEGLLLLIRVHGEQENIDSE